MDTLTPKPARVALTTTDLLFEKIQESPVVSDEALCILPWVGLEIRPDGAPAICCRSDFVLEQGPEPPVDRQNHKKLNALKSKMLKGEKPKECETCWGIERGGMLSVRQKLSLKFPQLREQILRQPEATFSTLLFDFKFGKLCNQKCLICSPYYSSLWSREPKHNAAAPIPKSNSNMDGLRSNTIGAYQQDLLNAEFVYLSGGEFFLNQRLLKEFAELFIQHKPKKSGKLFIITNGSVRPDLSILASLEKKFEEIGIFMSGDGTHEQFKYQRFPGEWETFLSTYRFLKETPYFGGINFTFSSLNLYYVPEYLKFWESQNELRFYYNFLNEPRALSIDTLPDEVLLGVREKLLKAQYRLGETQEIADSLLQFVQRLLLGKNRSNEIENFKSYVEFYDRHRKTDFAQTFSEYAELIGYRSPHWADADLPRALEQT